MAKARLSFDQFAAYSQAYLACRDALSACNPADSTQVAAGSLSWRSYARGWQWWEPALAGAAFYPTACLSRSFSVLTAEPTSEACADEPDVAEFAEEHFDAEHAEHDRDQEASANLVTITQSIHWSSIWQLPILHFHASNPSGQLLTLDQLKQLNLVYKAGTLPNEPPQGGGHEAAISLSDHPRTGLPSYYLHPCHTNQALASLVQHARREAHHNRTQEEAEQQQAEEQEEQEEQEGWRYMAAFISLCASAIEMRAE